mgnify:CR=1 FL=1
MENKEIILTLKGDEIKTVINGIDDRSTILSMILETYVNLAKEYVAEHNCGKKECHFTELNGALIADIDRIISLHAHLHKQ